MIGMRPGRHPAGALDDDQVPRLRPDAGLRQAASASGRRLPTSTRQVNSLNNLYPQATRAALPGAVGDPEGGHAAAGAVHQHRLDHRRRRVGRGDPAWRSRRSPSCCASGTTSAPAQPDDFEVRDMTEMMQHARLDDDADDQPAADRGGDLAGGRRRRDHEHHARVGDRADRARSACAWPSARAAATSSAQFLVEAVVLCLLGGAVGILLGRGGVARWCATLLHWPTEPSLAGDRRARSSSRRPSASSSATIRRGRRRGWTRSRGYVMSEHRLRGESNALMTAPMTNRCE